MVVGAFGALAMTGVRRVLGFSIISSIGYMILGLAVATPLALVGAVFYLFQDVVVKANLFLGAGAARRLTGSELFGALGRHLAAAALVLAPLPHPGAVAGRRAAVLRVLGQAPPRQADARRRALRARPSPCSAVGLLTLFAMARVWAEVFWDAHPDGDDAITGRLPAAMLAPLLVLTSSSSGSASTPAPSSTSRRRWRPRSSTPPPTSPRCWGRGHELLLWPWHVLVLPRVLARPRGVEPAGGAGRCWRPATVSQPRFVTVPLEPARDPTSRSPWSRTTSP